MKRRSFLKTGAAWSAASLFASRLSLAEARTYRPSSWPFFAFDNGVGRGQWEPERQAATLKRLGYDGISYNYTNNTDLQTWIRICREYGLTIYALYIRVAPDKTPAWDPKLREAFEMLKGSKTALWITVPLSKAQPPEVYGETVVENASGPHRPCPILRTPRRPLSARGVSYRNGGRFAAHRAKGGSSRH
jgi:hypothetical protein